MKKSQYHKWPLKTLIQYENGSQITESRFFYDIMIVKIESTRKTGEATRITIIVFLVEGHLL